MKPINLYLNALDVSVWGSGFRNREGQRAYRGTSLIRNHNNLAHKKPQQQGREKEAIILCLVRSNPRREVGFLSDDRRWNLTPTTSTTSSDLPAIQKLKFWVRGTNLSILEQQRGRLLRTNTERGDHPLPGPLQPTP